MYNIIWSLHSPKEMQSGNGRRHRQIVYHHSGRGEMSHDQEEKL